MRAPQISVPELFQKPRRACTMKKLTGFLAGVCLVFLGLVSCPDVAAAQDGAGRPAPPKVLVIQREGLKPGRTGNTHPKTESSFGQAMTSAKWAPPFLAVAAL